MAKRWIRLITKSWGIALLLCSAINPALASIPEKPAGGVFDEGQFLSLKTTHTIERIIAEHQKLTQETILFAIWKETPAGGLESATRDAFQEWKRTTPKPTNAILVGVDTKEGSFEIQVGLGLEQVLNHDEIERIRKKYFFPEFREGAIDRPFYLSLLEILKTLESPLVENGRAQAWIQESGFPGSFTPVSVRQAGNSWWIWILLGLIGMGGVFFVILEKEAHYTATGWSHVRRFPFLKRLLGRRKKVGAGLITGGGVSGRW